MSARRPSGTEAVDVDRAGLLSALRRRVDGEVRFDPGSRHLYARDASSYRHVPLGVVTPRSGEALAATLAVCRERGVPVTVRGGGTSLAGQAVNRGIVVDVARHLRRIVEVDPDARTATVEPGVVLSDLQAAAAPHGLRFGPDPSTSNRCTVGGMVGNDACGPHSVRWGRTSDNVSQLQVVTGDGHAVTAGLVPLEDARHEATGRGRRAMLLAGLLDLRERGAPLVADHFPTGLPRLVSGIHLDELCRPGALHLGRTLVGTEGTCAVTTAATVELVPRLQATALVVLGYPDDVAAARAVPDLLAHGPTAVEGLDARLVDGARRLARGRHAPGLGELPDGRAWLVVEVDGAAPPEAASAARAVADDAGVPAALITAPDEQQAIWRVRSAGLGSITYTPGGPTLHPGWEDAAVPPEQVATYLHGLHDLLDAHGLEAGVYGHYGDGCVHTKIGFDHATPAGRATMRAFVEAAADLVVSLGGSLSGEHGDGQARGELLGRMFGDEVLGLFGDFTRLWDPDGILNPDRLVGAAPLDQDLAGADLPLRTTPDTAFTFADQGGATAAFDRCVGAGTCRRDDGAATMCPSFRATHEERDSTRGRARLLGDLLRPDSGLTGFDDPSLSEALELCLSCKACARECPVGVDLATLKAEVAHQRFDRIGERRPAASALLGRFREVSRPAGLAPSTANALAASPLGRTVWRRLGLAPQRDLPAFASTTFRTAWRRRGGTRGAGSPVVLFVDTFTDVFAPQIAASAVRVLEETGHAVEAVTDVCCGRPRYAEGMLDAARADLDALVSRLSATTDAPVVWLEPSCLSVLRDERADLRPDPAAARVAERSMTLAELAMAESWPLPRLDRGLALHPHCHHRASLGIDADLAVLDRLGSPGADLDAGCCGLAGSFGFVAGDRYDVSMAVAEDRFAPRLRAAAEAGHVGVLDGFSCREQADHLGLVGRRLHLAEVLDAALSP